MHSAGEAAGTDVPGRPRAAAGVIIIAFPELAIADTNSAATTMKIACALVEYFALGLEPAQRIQAHSL